MKKQLQWVWDSTSNFTKKERKIADAHVSIFEILIHCIVNTIFGLSGSIVILSLSVGNIWLICCCYYFHKQFESKILNRNKYITKLGKNWIYPIPSTIGFIGGYLLFKKFGLI